MCGILGVFATNKPQEVRKRLFEIYNNQKSRGKDGFGFAVSDNGKVTRKRYRTENGVFKNSKFKHVVKNGTGIMVHHRFPTSTRNIVECNHPIADENGNICLIHNGMISNAEELKKSFSAHKFETEITNCNVIKTGNKQYITETEKQFTDSEVLVHVLESGINSKNFRKPLETMLKKISGSYSIAWFCKNDKRMHLFKNGNPLAVFEDHIGNVFFASEFPIVGDFKLIKELEDGEYGVIDSNGYKKIARLKINRYDYFEHDLNNYASWKPTVTHGKSPDIQEQLSELFACYLPGLDLEDEEFLIAEIIEVFDTYSNEINCQIKELKSALALQEVA